MAAIKRIDIKLHTANRSYAGTDSHVFVAVAGREFHVDSGVDDFERGDDRVYTLGEGANINNAAINDPRGPVQLDTADVDRFPVWLRMEPAGSNANWNVESVQVTVNPGPGEIVFRALWGGDKRIWLGQNSGKFVFLRKA